MTYRQVHGLWFKVHSPSLYELVATDDGSDIDMVTLAYGSDLHWHIDVLMKRGTVHHRGPFQSRDEAAALIAGRRAA